MLSAFMTLKVLLQEIFAFFFQTRTENTDLIFAQDDEKLIYCGSSRELAQRVEQDRRTAQFRKLFGRCFLAFTGWCCRHARSQPCRRNNDHNLHRGYEYK